MVRLWEYNFNEIWKPCCKLFHGKWLRCMTGPYSRGELINNDKWIWSRCTSDEIQWNTGI
jgi:hypothetical protein